jgi:hypothetical protein
VSTLLLIGAVVLAVTVALGAGDDYQPALHR